MRYVIICGLFIINVNAFSQLHFVRQWDIHYGTLKDEWSFSFDQTLDGGFLVGGPVQAGIGGDKTEPRRDVDTFYLDYWVVKMDAGGNKLWDKTFGTNYSDYLSGIIGTADGGSLLTGNSTGLASGDRTENGKGGADYWVIKTDAQGNKQWDKTYGGPSDDITFIYPIQTRDGGYLIGGRSESGIGGDKTEPKRGAFDDYWLVKIDSLGNKQWDKTLGGPHDENIKSMIQTKDGGYLVGGYSRSDIGGDKTQPNWDTTIFKWSDWWIVKIDSFGNKQWDKTYGTIASDELYSIVELNNGNYALQGWGNAGATGNKTVDSGGVWIVIIDSLGEINSQAVLKCPYGGMKKTSDRGFLLFGDKFNNYPLNQYMSELNFNNAYKNSWVMKLDSNWNKQWDKTILTRGVNETFALETLDGCYAVASLSGASVGGDQMHQPTNLGLDYFIFKFCMDTVTGINESTNDAINIVTYPNPFTASLQIAIASPQVTEATFTLTNAIGQLIYRSKETQLAAGYTKSLDLSYLPKGVYFIEVKAQQGGKVVKRVVKE